MENQIIEYAPILIVVLAFIWQHNVFVKPEQLEKKHREILNEMNQKLKEVEKDFDGKYVELNAYKEFQNHIYSELSKISLTVDNCSTNIEDLKNLIMGGR